MLKEQRKSQTLKENKKKTKQERKKNQNGGITLIALVVTIVVLLILAGITITMVLGEDGILSQAKLAAQKTKEAEEQQAQDLDSLVGMVSDAINGKDPELLSDATSNHKIFSNTTSYDASGNKIEEGSESPEEKAAITVPAGFKITEGDLDSIDQGVVISDEAGNEFVWVPCTAEEYKNHDYNARQDKNDAGHNIEDKENGVDAGWNTWYYTNYSDWTGDKNQESKNEESVATYGGFYIARYEAGVPSNASFYVKAAQSDNMPFSTDKNVTTFKPVSKKGVQAWNYISQTNAKTVSEKMYSGNRSVTSQLVDGTAWDTIVEWIAEDQSLADIVEKDSTEHGNYGNTSESYQKPNNGGKYKKLTISSNVLYAQHLEKWEDNTGKGWNPAKIYKYGTPTTGIVSNYNGDFTGNRNEKEEKDGLTYRQHLELSTGASEDTKLKNIYDLGGNMYEWTTETGYHKTETDSQANSTQYAVLRGGGFGNYGSGRPVSLRNGDYAVGVTNPDLGFRVVLYVK